MPHTHAEVVFPPNMFYKFHPRSVDFNILYRISFGRLKFTLIYSSFLFHCVKIEKLGLKISSFFSKEALNYLIFYV